MAKSDALFVTEAQCAERLGLSLDQYNTALIAAGKAGFPQPDPLFADRRYWPAVRVWLDRRYGIGEERGMLSIPALDGKEKWK
ncbi:winged helix-turn-helix domain-containing protein [Agrobacterium pusense]|uniref:winged helix-turn-helix domain-containing protein n=1 Tax=Agrobacterium pusense TaxID=648995 RepID=UPI0035A5B117